MAVLLALVMSGRMRIETGHPRRAVRSAVPCLTLTLLLLWHPGVRTQTGPGGTAQTLTGDDVMAIITVAATALSDNAMAVAVVDRTGRFSASMRGLAPARGLPTWL